jgi:hypothetical protein
MRHHHGVYPVCPEPIADMVRQYGSRARVASVDDVDRPILTNSVSDRDSVAASLRINLQKINFKEITHCMRSW